MNIEWCVIGFGIRHMFTIGHIESYIEKVNAFLVCLESDFQAMFSEYRT